MRPGSSDSNLGKSLWRLQHVERKLADIEGTSRDFIASTNDDKIFSASNAFLAIFTQPKYRSNPSRQPETREYTSRGAFARAAEMSRLFGMRLLRARRYNLQDSPSRGLRHG